MNIGITFDLRDDYLRQGYSAEETAEFDSAETIDAIDDALISLGHATLRIGNVAALTTRVAAGERWDLVFNIAEGLNGIGREAQVPALLEAFSIPCTFSDSSVLALTLHKGLTKHVVRDIGILTPDFLVVEKNSDVDAVRMPFPLFAKPVAGGTSMGISALSKVSSLQQLRGLCCALLERTGQPVLVEAFLPGRELTVGIVGTGARARVLGVMEILLQPEAEPDVYSHANKTHYEQRVRYRLVEGALAAEAGELALAVWNGLRCRDGGRVDLRADDTGRLSFLEINPLAGLHPVDSDLVILCRLLAVPYVQLIQWIVESASERLAQREARTGTAATPGGATRTGALQAASGRDILRT